jgi:hypothetical protein
MIWGPEDRAGWSVDIAAAAIFAAAVGFAAWAVGSGVGMAPAAAASLVVTYSGLRRIVPEEQTFAVPNFQLATIEPTPQAWSDAADELILEDELGEVSPHARVVRLFGSSQSHLPSNHMRSAPSDASQALIEALAELRRSLH